MKYHYNQTNKLLRWNDLHSLEVNVLLSSKEHSKQLLLQLDVILSSKIGLFSTKMIENPGFLAQKFKCSKFLLLYLKVLEEKKILENMKLLSFVS